ncbi:MAG: hypothetical protein ACFFDX_10685 [Candidatus Odinarchaeota archaeon]
MTKKQPNDTNSESKDFVDLKIQYGESQINCFACGEKIKTGTKICPYCNTKQESIISK